MQGGKWFRRRERRRLLVPRCGAGLALALGFALVFVLAAAPPAAAQFPLNSCLTDVQGANDEPGQKDLTKFCAEGGTGVWEVFTSWNWDETRFTGNNTGDGCSLYDSDNDGLANFAVCVTIGGDPAQWLSTKLYRCDDTNPDKCSGHVELTGPFQTTCSAVANAPDPFPAGDAYPNDTQAQCKVDTADFGSSDARLIDACSYPSNEPNSDPSDCVIEIPKCESNADCTDGNACTDDVCNLTTGFCNYQPSAPGTSCDDGLFCTEGDVCNSEGLCTAGSPRVCTDSNTCTTDACNEALDQCTYTNVADGTTCGNGPLGVCDAQDVCQSGTCIDALVVAGTQCRASAGICDVAEACNGINKDCPPDQLVASGTECRASAGVCDVAEACTGSSALCPTDAFRPDTYVCRAAGDECGAEELCTGSGPDCPADSSAPAGTPCGDPSDEGCNAPDTCDGSGTCVNNIEEPGEVCRAAASDCDVAEVCQSDGTCPDDAFKGEGEACGSDTSNVCTDPDTCDGSGLCLPNNKACGWVTDSSLCEFDVAGDACGLGSKEFRLLFTPDAQNWIAYKQNASNPGQFYYNAFIEGDEGEVVPTTIKVPWPFVSQGANPVHVYDGTLVTSTVDGPFCLLPPEWALAAYPATITLADRIDGTSKSGDHYTVTCPAVTFNPADPSLAFCTVDLWVTVPASGLAYVNMHLDYGTKGPHTDMNPADGPEDRYDKDGASNALVNTSDNNGDVAIAQCSAYPFSHTVQGEPFGDTVYNLNEFKKIAGVFGQVSNAGTSASIAGATLTLLRRGSPVATAQTDEDGYYLMGYKHTGKSEIYLVRLEGAGMTKQVELKANGWAEANFEVAPVTTAAGGVQ